MSLTGDVRHVKIGTSYINKRRTVDIWVIVNQAMTQFCILYTQLCAKCAASETQSLAQKGLADCLDVSGSAKASSQRKTGLWESFRSFWFDLKNIFRLKSWQNSEKQFEVGEERFRLFKGTSFDRKATDFANESRILRIIPISGLNFGIEWKVFCCKAAADLWEMASSAGKVLICPNIHRKATDMCHQNKIGAFSYLFFEHFFRIFLALRVPFS